MKRTLAQISLLLLSVLLSSCLEMTSVITVNKDSSAIIEETVLVSAQLKAMMSAGAGGADQGGGPSLKDILPDQAKAEERAKKLGKGVTVKSHETIKAPDGREGVKVTYAVEDIDELEYEPFNSDDKAGKEKQPVTFELKDGTLTVSMPEPKKDAKPAEEKPKMPKEQMEAQMAMVKPMFAGMRVTFQIKGAASSDATYFKDGTVTVMDLQFDKILEKPEVFTKFMDSSDDNNMTPGKAAEMFKGVDGVKIEGKEEFTMKLK